MPNTRKHASKQESRRKERRRKRTKREDERPRSIPSAEQRNREEDAPRPPMSGGREDEP